MTSASVHDKETRSLIRPHDLGERVQLGLCHGRKAARYHSERSLVFAVIMSALHRGFTFPDLSSSFRTGTLQCPAVRRWQIQGGDQRADRELLRLWQAAEQVVVTDGDPQAVALELTRLREAIEVLPLPGRGGPSERAVLLAVVHQALAQTSRMPRISYIELALATGKSGSVVEDALNRLIARGLLRRAEEGRFDRRTRWTIDSTKVMAATRGGNHDPITGTQAHPDLVPSSADDLWSALGLVAWEVLRLLTTQGGHTASQVAQALGRNPHVVRKHLNRLRDEHQLVERDSDRVWTAQLDSTSLQTAARQAGVEGAGEQHEQRVRERDASLRGWVDSRTQAVSQAALFHRVRTSYLASSFLGYTPRGGLRFVVLDHQAITWSTWKSAGCPEDYREIISPT